MTRGFRCAAAILLLSVPTLAACNSESKGPAVSAQSLSDLCERPTQFLTQVWQFADPVVGEPGLIDRENPGKIGSGGSCEFTANGARLAHVFITRDVSGLGDPPADAHLISVGEQIVKTWEIDSTSLTFETVSGGWEGTMTLIRKADLETNKPTATDEQITATANELVKLLGEFKGPDR